MQRPRIPSKLSESLHQRLNFYALAASAAGVGVLALVQPAQAKIIYTKIHRIIGPDQDYSLDLNRDRVTDFTFHNRTYLLGTSTGDASFYAQIAGQTAPDGNSHVGYVSRGGWRVDSAMKKGERIGGDRPFQSQSGVLLEADSWGGEHGLWHKATNRYLGLKFKIKGKTHYGWARLTVTGKTFGTIKMTLTGYAYETVPDKPIIAGKTHGKDVITLEPASLGHLARGASAIPAWRPKGSK